MSVRRWLLLGGGYALVMLAWMFSTYPFHAPDETAHFLRAYGLSQGHLVGPPAPYFGRLSTAQAAWVNHDSRGVTVPAAFAPPGVNCTNGTRDTTRCVEPSATGNYQPLAYLLPAAALHAASNVDNGIWLARGAAALGALVLLLLAAWLLWDGSAGSLTGLMLAATPMTLFVGTVLNPNGLELAGQLALCAAVLRIAREPARVPRAVWIAAALAGVVVILAWQLGPVFALIDLALLGALLGRSGARLLPARPALRCAGALVASVLLFAAYAIHAGTLHSQFHLSPLRFSLQTGWNHLGGALNQSIGHFGELTIRLPNWIVAAWEALVVALSATALALATPRLRWIFASTMLLALAFPVLFYGFVYRYTGFGLQGRYVLPVLAIVPLLGGEVVRQAPGVRLARRLPSLLACTAPLLGLAAWWHNAGANAGLPGPGLSSPFSAARWSPPAGWWPWASAALLGALLLLGAASLPGAPHRPRR